MSQSRSSKEKASAPTPTSKEGNERILFELPFEEPHDLVAAAPDVTITASVVTVGANSYSLEGVENVHVDFVRLRENETLFWGGWALIVSGIVFFLTSVFVIGVGLVYLFLGAKS